MAITPKEILEETRTWPREHLAELVDALVHNLHGGDSSDIEDSWKEEARSRLRQIEQGSVNLIPGNSVSQQIRKIVGE